jgi:hypothetical protein
MSCWSLLAGNAPKSGTIIAGEWRPATFPEAALRVLYKPLPGLCSRQPPATLAEAYDTLYGLLAGTDRDAFAARSALATLEHHWAPDPRIPRPIEAYADVQFFLMIRFTGTATNSAAPHDPAAGAQLT